MGMTTADLARRGSPERIGNFQILERIGRGAMGVVYRARDEALGREVALKVLTADFDDEPEIRARFQREAEAAARLSHPNIITIFDIGEDNGRFFIVMELLRGAVLKDFLKQPNAAPLEQKIDFMRQLCAGLGAAHRASIYHRDIKPGNIFVRTDGVLKILDFGIARLASSSMTAAGFIVGTPDYMSPEQARGEEIDGRSDIFSAGGVFYFMLTGRKPFRGELPALFHQIQFDEPLPLGPDIAAELAAIVSKALSKKRERRYQTCQDLIADLEAAVELCASSGSTPVDAPDSGHFPTTEATASGDQSPASDDTVDMAPIPLFNSDDTVRLGQPPTWMMRMVSRIDSAVSGTFARLGRRGTTAPTKQRGATKR
jgi:serine/threonine-protein kinase